MDKNKNKNKNKTKIRKFFLIFSGILLLVVMSYVFFIMLKIKDNKEDIKKENEISEDIDKKDNENNKDDKNIEKMFVKIPKYYFSQKENKFITKFEKYEVEKSEKVLTKTLEKLFELRSENGIEIWNGLKFKGVSINNKVAKIILTGKWYPDGDMSGLFFKKEIEAAAKQFPTIDKVKVYINNDIFDWCVDDEKDGCENGNNIPWDETIVKNNNQANNNNNNNNNQTNNNNGNNTNSYVTQDPNWVACDNLFPYIGNQGNSTFMDTEMGALAYTNGNTIQISTGYEIRGCIQKLAGTYDNWTPFEGVVGSFKLKDSGGVVIETGALYGHKMPASSASDLMQAVISGENIYFKETIDSDLSSYSGQNGVIEIWNDNPSGESINDRMKSYPIVFQ